MTMALGVMARAPVLGRCKTRLARGIGAERATAIYAAMLNDTLATFGAIAAARHVLFAAPEDDGVAHLAAMAPAPWDVVAQEGADLGERLTRAMAVLHEGGRAAVVVGSDAPIVPREAIAAALATFALGDARRALLGPSDDGGYYLLGLTAPAPDVFRGIAWSTEVVLAQTRARCDALGLAVTTLPSAYDVDDVDDLRRLEADLARAPHLAPHVASALASSPFRR